MNLLSLLTVLLAFTCHALADYPAPQAVTGNTAVHDPTICQDRHGTYFLFCMSHFVAQNIIPTANG